MVITIKVEDGDQRGLDSPAEMLARELRGKFAIGEVSRIDVQYSERTVIKF
jgi:hypothetical protein